MTKAKLHETVLELCKEHEASEELTAALDALTKPKVGGSSDVNDYTVFDANGEVTHIFCNMFKLWVPVVNEDGEPNFKADKKSKNGYWRDSNAGVAQFRELDRQIKASKAAIMKDLLDEVITGSEAKEAISELGTAREKVVAPDNFGTVERPEA